MPNDENTASGSSETAWLGRFVARVENSVDKLADRLASIERAISSDMKEMREGFRAEVHKNRNEMNGAIAKLQDEFDRCITKQQEEFNKCIDHLEGKVDALEKANAQQEVTNRILQFIGAGCLAGLVGLAVTRIYNPPPVVTSPHPVEQRK